MPHEGSVWNDVKHIGGCPVCGGGDWCTYRILPGRNAIAVRCMRETSKAIRVRENEGGHPYGEHQIRNLPTPGDSGILPTYPMEDLLEMDFTKPKPFYPVTVPEQFQRDDLAFTLIPRGEKAPRIPGWNQVAKGRRYDDGTLEMHLRDGGNYGVYPAPGSLVLFLDVDDADRFHKVGGLSLTRDTFTYSAWPDSRRYRAVVRCPDYPREWAGRKLNVDGVFEVYFPAGTEKTGGLCVGPNSLHPNGNIYAVTHNTSFQTVLWDAITTLVDRIKPNAHKVSIPREVYWKAGKTPLRDRYNLHLEWPYNPYPTRHGEVRGASPFHDSTTGDNTAINPDKGVFYCFRHGVGYDAAGCEAIRREIIECGEPFDGEAFKKLVAKLEYDFPEVRYLERVKYRRQKKAERRRKIEEARNHD